jgi:hypothetical protein
MIKAGTSPDSVSQGLMWLSRHKMANGTWGSTQATILAMRALIAGTTASIGQEYESTVTLLVNGEKIEAFRLNRDNSDVMKQVEVTKYLRGGDNRIELRQSPAGELPFQCAGAYWLPSGQSAASAVGRVTEPLQIDLDYDRTSLAVNDQIACTVTVRNHTGQVINMVIVDLGIPPGFDVDTTGFEGMRQAGQIAKYELTGNQVILYLRELSGTQPLQFNYSLRAKYPLRVQTSPSAVYEYYQPGNRAESKTAALQVADSP